MKTLLLSSVLLSMVSANGWAQVSFSTFVNGPAISTAVGQNNVIGIAYAGNEFVGSLYQGTFNDQLYSTNLTGGNVKAFGSPIPGGFQGEVVVTASLGKAGFATGDIYTGAGDNIYHYANNGTYLGQFASFGSLVRGVMFDPGSSFGGDLLVTLTNGQVYKVDSSGNETLLADTHEDTEGMDIATSAWGPYAGDLLVASEGSGDLRFITPAGNIVATCTDCIDEAEVVSFVPTSFGVNPSPVEGYYEANYPENIQYAGPSDFSTLTGDVIVTSEFSSNAPVYAIKYSGNVSSPFGAATLVGNLPNQAEDGIFVTAQKVTDLTSPEPSSVLLFGTLVIGLGLMLRRKLRA